MKIFFKKSILVTSGIVALAAISLVVYLRRPRYEVVEVHRGEIVEAVYGLGTVKTDVQYEVKLGVASILDRLFVKEGDPVKAGDSLAIFERSLVFKTPIAGTVTWVGAHQEELVPPSVVVVRVENLQQRYIEVAMEQEGALRMAPGQQATVLFESLRGEKFVGKVSAVFSRNQEFLAHIQIGELRESILPGMTADVGIEISRHQNALLVPLSSLQGGRVIVVDKGIKRKIPVKIGAIDGAWGEVLEGALKVGDRVVVKKSSKKE